MIEKAEKEYDLVIIGGGPAGLSMAISVLQKMDISVLIIDAKKANALRIGESCSPELLILMHQLGLQKEFQGAGHLASPGYASMWGNDRVGFNDSIVSPLGPSWSLNRPVFDSMLVNRAVYLNANIKWETRFLENMQEINDKNYRLQLLDVNSNKTFVVNANFVVDASGTKSKFARSLGLKKTLKDSLFAHVQMADIKSGSMTKRVQLESVHDGWWYQSYLPEDRIVSMKVTSKNKIRSLQDKESQLFKSELSSTSFLSKELEKLTLMNRQYSTWPILSGILPTLEGTDWLAIGDAASSFDPIMAQGIIKGLSDGIKGANKLTHYFGNNQDYEHQSFAEMVQRRYVQYENNRPYSYALESRWINERFWKERLHK